MLWKVFNFVTRREELFKFLLPLLTQTLKALRQTASIAFNNCPAVAAELV